MTHKQSGLNGVDYAVPTPIRHKHPCPPPPPKPPVPPCPVPHEWDVYPFYPPYPDMPPAPVPRPDIPEHHHHHHPCPPPFPPYPPVPPYPPPKPEKVDECSKKLAKLSQKVRVLVQMINDFEDKNKAAILTIGPNSYQFGTENVTDFDGEPAKGMYADLICGDPIEQLDEDDYVVDETKTRVCLKNPVDLLQSELARVRQEITLVAAAVNKEVSEDNAPDFHGLIPGTDE